MQEKGRGGKTALHILAFIGITLALLIIAALAAVYIATKGPSETARGNVVEWADGHGLGFAATLFLSDEEENAILNGEASPEPDGGQSDTEGAAFITVTDEAPIMTAAPDDGAEETPDASAEETPEASPAESGGEEETA